jgi:outer membrane protein TolC
VLDTQRTLLSSQDSVSTVAASISTDHIRLYKALGGGWTPTVARCRCHARGPNSQP